MGGTVKFAPRLKNGSSFSQASVQNIIYGVQNCAKCVQNSGISLFEFPLVRGANLTDLLNRLS